MVLYANIKKINWKNLLKNIMHRITKIILI
jgi:hypothetical protein